VSRSDQALLGRVAEQLRMPYEEATQIAIEGERANLVVNSLTTFGGIAAPAAASTASV